MCNRLLLSLPYNLGNYGQTVKKLDFDQSTEQATNNVDLDESVLETEGRRVTEHPDWRNIFDQSNKTLVIEVGDANLPIQSETIRKAYDARAAEYSFDTSGVCVGCGKYEHWLSAGTNLCYECSWNENVSRWSESPPEKPSINLSDLVSEYSDDEHHELAEVGEFVNFLDRSHLSSTRMAVGEQSIRESSATTQQQQPSTFTFLDGIDDIMNFLESIDAPRAGTPSRSPFGSDVPSPRFLAEALLMRSRTPKRTPNTPGSTASVRKPIAFCLSLADSPPLIVDSLRQSDSNWPFSPLYSNGRSRRYVDPTQVMRPINCNEDYDDLLPIIDLSDVDDVETTVRTEMSPGNFEGMQYIYIYRREKIHLNVQCKKRCQFSIHLVYYIYYCCNSSSTSTVLKVLAKSMIRYTSNIINNTVANHIVKSLFTVI